jgi:hypothetical protein
VPEGSHMNSIPQSRMILYLLIAGLIPIFLVIFIISEQLGSVEELQNSISRIEMLALTREQKQALNMTVREHFKGAERFYVDKHLETLTFMEPEIESLQKLVNNRYFAGDETVKKRLDFLTGPSNSLLLSEGNVQAYPFFQETTSSLIHPIELNIDDLKKLLTVVEGVPIGEYEPPQDRPQMIVTDFKLDKKVASENNEVFILNMKILKREYL